MSDEEDSGSGEISPIRVSRLWWELGGSTGDIERTAQAWRGLGRRAERRSDNLVEGTSDLLSSRWEGEARDSFADHLGRLVDDLDEVKTQAESVAEHLDGVASLLSTYQGSLDEARERIRKKVASYLEPSLWGFNGDVVFYPQDDDEVAAVRAAVVEAGEIREEFDTALAGYPSNFSTQPWAAVSRNWTAVVTGARDPFVLPPEVDGTSVLMIDGDVVINTGAGDDDVSVTVDPETGDLLVDVNGVAYRYPSGTPITIRTGEGHDVIEVAPEVTVGLVLIGGEGNDRIRGGSGRDIILGGHGNDDLFGGDGGSYLSGGSGRDYLEGQGGNDQLFGGHGDDVIYGLSGNNYIAGGEGDNYLHGGRGNDTIDGGAGDDVLVGGQGDNTLRGGGGDNVLYGGGGSDIIEGGSGQNTAYRQTGDQVTNVATDVRVEVTDDAGFIKIEGSPEFQERVQADLDMLQASPTGQQMLAELRDMRDPNILPGERSLTIRELENDPNYRPNDPQDPGENGFARRGSNIFGNDKSEIGYNPSFTFDRQEGNPVTVLYHEMAHVYSYWNGNYDGDPVVGGPDDGIRKSERQAVGLPYDHDDDPETPDRIDPEQPLTFTENGLREELGLPRRESYR